jgi:hypothetical protein
MIPDSGELLACTCAFDRYVDYVPLYILAFLRAYPAAAARILVDRTPLAPAIERALAVVRDRVSDRFEVVAWTDRGLPAGDHPAFGRALRFLLGREHFAGFTYGLTTDIDSLTVPQTPTLLEQELDQARILGMPYSNVMRLPFFPGEAVGRLAGWHFLVVEPYFETMQAVVERGRRDLLVDLPGPDSGHPYWACHEEHVLYQVVREGLSVHEPSSVRPFTYSLEHGFHLGLHRVGSPWHPHYRHGEWQRQGLALLAEPALAEVLRLASPWVRGQVESLAAFVGAPPPCGTADDAPGLYGP